MATSERNFKIGFACKYLKTDGTLDPDLNDRSTTLTSFRKKTTKEQHELLRQILTHNITNLKNRVQKLGQEPLALRFYRIGSDILPFRTHELAQDFYQTPSIKNWLESQLQTIGVNAEAAGIRLSFHPGQFTMLVSDKSQVVDRSIDELHYHAEFFELMGVNLDTTCVNIHVGAQTPDFEQIFRTNFARLSNTAQKLLAIENDEFSYGVDKTAKLQDIVKLTLDVHHHWIKTGHYILPSDPFIQTTIDSWRGARPKLHYAISREDLLVDHNPDKLPCFTTLTSQGYKKGKLRAHSDCVWNNETNKYVLGFSDTHDIMVEAKNKNLASLRLYEEFKKMHPICCPRLNI